MVRPTAALLVLLAIPLQGAIAQGSKDAPTTQSGVLGIVVDSIHGGPLPGALVRVGATGRQGVTDAKGYYRIDSVPTGTHRVSLHHPLVDTLGMIIETQPIEFPAGHVPVVPLATPSAETMLRIACPKLASPEGPAGLLGVVRDPDTRAPAIGAKVSLSWTEVRASKELGVRRARRLRSAVVDSAGNYAICGLPMELGGTVQVTHDGASTAGVEIAIDDISPIALRSLGLGASEPVTDTVNGVIRTLRRGAATLRGRIVGPDGGAVAGARVEVPGTPQLALSTPTGAFALSGLPAGTQAVVVRGVGFTPSRTIVELSAKTPREITVTLGSIQVLETLETEVAATNLDRVGFTERKRTGMGRFLGREDIEKRNPMVLTDVFTAMPGIRLTTDRSGNQVLASTRGVPGEAGSCVSVFVDRAQWHAIRPERLVQDLNQMVRPEQVYAVEVYQPLEVPGEFTTSGQRCLTVVIWTRMSVGELPQQR